MAGSISAVLVITCAFIESLLWGLILCFIAGSLYLWFSMLYWFKIDDGLIPASVLLQEVNIDETLETMDNISQDTLIGQVESKDDNTVHLTVLAPVKNDICSSFTTTPAMSPAKSLNLSSYYWTGISFASETSSLPPAEEERPLSFEVSAEKIIKRVEPSFSFLIADSESKQFLDDLSLDIPAISGNQRQDRSDARSMGTSAERIQELVSPLHPESPQTIDEDSLYIKMALAKSSGVADSLLTSSLPSLLEISFYGDELSRVLEFPPKKAHTDISAEKQSDHVDLVAPMPCSESMECIPDLSLNHADLDISTSEFSFAVFGASIDLPGPPLIDNEGDSVDIKKILAGFHGASSSPPPPCLLDVGFPSAPSIRSIPRKVSSKKTVASTSRNVLATVSNISGLTVSSVMSSGSGSKKTSSVKPKGKENLRSRLPRVSAIPKRTWRAST